MVAQSSFEAFLQESYRMRDEALRDGRKPRMLLFGPDAMKAMLDHFDNVPTVCLKEVAQEFADKRRGELAGLPWKKMRAPGIALQFD